MMKGEGGTIMEKLRFTQGMKRCSHCEKSTLLGNFCSECGDMLGVCSIELPVRECKKCGEKIPDREFCIMCGSKKEDYIFSNLSIEPIDFDER